MQTERALPFQKLVVGGIPTVVATRVELASLMLTDCQDRAAGTRSGPRLVFSSNGAVIAAYHSNLAFRETILQADVVDADGMSLVLATRLLCKEPLKERVATTDFIHEASSVAAENGLKFFFLGGRAGVASQAAANLTTLYPELKIVGVQHGYFEEQAEAAVCAKISSSGADVLWVGLGSPFQEQFAVRNRSRLKDLAWIRTCGGLFDHYSDGAKRAPAWMQAFGLEWLHRAAREPKRLGVRYLRTNPSAAYHLLTKTSRSQTPQRRRPR